MNPTVWFEIFIRSNNFQKVINFLIELTILQLQKKTLETLCNRYPINIFFLPQTKLSIKTYESYRPNSAKKASDEYCNKDEILKRYLNFEKYMEREIRR